MRFDAVDHDAAAELAARDRRRKSGHDQAQGGFARLIGSGDSQDATRLHAQAHVLERRRRSARVAVGGGDQLDGHG